MTRPTKLDATDEEIIRILSEDGRQGSSVIGRELGLSEGAIRKRLKRLVSSNVISYGLVVDVQATGMTISGWLEVEAHPAQVRAVGALIGSKTCCEFCCLTTGKAAVRAWVYLGSLDELHALTQEISRQPGVIDVTFRVVVDHAQHRHGMIYLTDRQGDEKR